MLYGMQSIPPQFTRRRMEERKLKIEKRAIHFSFAGTLFFAVLEFIMFLIIGSRAVLMDFIFDFVDVILAGPFLVLIPLLYKPETERRPYGYGQFESLFIIIKYVGLVFVCMMLLIQNISTILKGGASVNAIDVFSYESIAALITFLFYIGLTYISKKYQSVIIAEEVYSWKIDVWISLSLSISFLLSILMQDTRLAYLTPYVDPLVAIIMTVILLINPIREIIRNVKNMLLISAPLTEVNYVREIAQDELDKYDCKISFLEVLQIGRKVWIEIYIDPDSDVVLLRYLKQAQIRIKWRMKDHFDQFYVEIIPDLYT